MRRVRGIDGGGGVRGTGPLVRLVAVVAVAGMTLATAACGKPPADGEGDAGGKKFKACMVTDTGGVDDRSFNASAWKGLQDAKAEDKNIEVTYATSKADTDYEPNLQQFAQQRCDIVLAVGGLMAEATQKVAKQNPKVTFAMVDSKIDLPNVYSMEFNTAQSSFQAGYLAAAYSKTGKVATFGGMKIPPVTIFMDGFWQGVQHYNSVKGKSVQVLGWDEKTQNGSFAGSFTDLNAGKSRAEGFKAQGADVIFPVAGGTGLGAARVAMDSKDTSNPMSAIWVDVDGCVSAADYCDIFLSTVVKNIPNAVKDGVIKASKGEAIGGTAFAGTLDNNGTSLAPYNKFDGKVPAELKKEIDQLKADIVAGKIPITSPSQPK